MTYRQYGEKGKHMIYEYGMRLRPFSIGCQPMNGLINVKPERIIGSRHYWNILVYSRELTDKELRDYELDDLSKRYTVKMKGA